jgi:hypothetical protein
VKRRKWKRTKPPPQKRAVSRYSQVTRIVDGAISDAMRSHPDYFVREKIGDARRSIVKRVTGSLIGYLAESTAKRGRSGQSTGG